MNIMIKTQDLCKKYLQGRTEVTAIDNVSIEIYQNETVAIMRKSGSGKTTLLKVINGLLVPDNGKVFINGIDLYSIKETERCAIRKKSIGFVFQSYELIPEFTVSENIIFPAMLNKTKHDSEYLEELYEKLEIVDKTTCYPAELSGGEAQRVAIARALINKPDILLCDEPTGNLDEETSNQVMHMLMETSKTYGTTLVVVTHDNDIAAYANRTIHLSSGRVI